MFFAHFIKGMSEEIPVLTQWCVFEDWEYEPVMVGVLLKERD
jgi:hypothetical protein